MRSITIRALAWTVAVVGTTWLLAFVLVLSSLGICGPYGFRADLSQWIQFPAPQIALLFEKDSQTPAFAEHLATISQFVFWFVPMTIWQRRKTGRSQLRPIANEKTA